MTTPFTYVLTHKPSGRRYYGARWANGCQPSDLWSLYFTSSKVVKKLIKEDGKESFDFKIRKVFSSKKECRDWERRVLVRLKVKKKEEWLNEGYGSVPDQTGFRHSKETREKMSKSHMGISRPMPFLIERNKDKSIFTSEVRRKGVETKRRNGTLGNGMLGKKHSPESIQKMSANRKGKGGASPSEETRKKQSLARSLYWKRKKEA